MEDKAVARALIESLCRTHPAYREPADERRAYNRQKQAELGDDYPNWYFKRYMAVDEFIDQRAPDPLPN